MPTVIYPGGGSGGGGGTSLTIQEEGSDVQTSVNTINFVGADVQAQAGGAGISLHDLNGKYPRMALISPSYSAIILKQCLGRVHRDGSKTKALQRIVFVANTVEEEVCEKVKDKLHNLDLINDGVLSLDNEKLFERK